MPSWVYEIIHTATKECVYVGSSTNDYFCRRRCDHMKPTTMEKRKELKLYKHIADAGGWDNFSFNIIHERPDMDKTDLLNLEKQEIALRNPLCNINSPITTKEERKEAKRIDQHNFRQRNPDKVKEYLLKSKEKESYKEHVKERCSTKIDCPCGGTYTLQNKTNHYKRDIHQKYLTTVDETTGS